MNKAPVRGFCRRIWSISKDERRNRVDRAHCQVLARILSQGNAKTSKLNSLAQFGRNEQTQKLLELSSCCTVGRHLEKAGVCTVSTGHCDVFPTHERKKSGWKGNSSVNSLVELLSPTGGENIRRQATPLDFAIFLAERAQSQQSPKANKRSKSPKIRPRGQRPVAMRETKPMESGKAKNKRN